MSRDISTLRRPSPLELLFYDELVAPMRHYAYTAKGGPNHTRDIKLRTQRFKRDIERYGYVCTREGIMMRAESDVINTCLNSDVQSKVVADMQLLERLMRR